MVGGYLRGDALSSVELFPRPLSDACVVPDLPQGRSGHSVSLLPGGRLVVCGGESRGGWMDSCISWVAGNSNWTTFYTMRCLSKPHNYLQIHNHNSVPRSSHVAWVPPSIPNSIVLLSGDTAEILPGNKAFSQTSVYSLPRWQHFSTENQHWRI